MFGKGCMFCFLLAECMCGGLSTLVYPAKSPHSFSALKTLKDTWKVADLLASRVVSCSWILEHVLPFILWMLCENFNYFGEVLRKLWSFEKVMKFWESCQFMRKLWCFECFKLFGENCRKLTCWSFLYCPNLWYLFVCSGLRPEKRLRIWSYRLLEFRSASDRLWF